VQGYRGCLGRIPVYGSPTGTTSWRPGVQIGLPFGESPTGWVYAFTTRKHARPAVKRLKREKSRDPIAACSVLALPKIICF
jgi:hypothetical protein